MGKIKAQNRLTLDDTNSSEKNPPSPKFGMGLRHKGTSNKCATPTRLQAARKQSTNKCVACLQPVPNHLSAQQHAANLAAAAMNQGSQEAAE
jgi:hypothetical protein